MNNTTTPGIETIRPRRNWGSILTLNDNKMTTKKRLYYEFESGLLISLAHYNLPLAIRSIKSDLIRTHQIKPGEYWVKIIQEDTPLVIYSIDLNGKITGKDLVCPLTGRTL